MKEKFKHFAGWIRAMGERGNFPQVIPVTVGGGNADMVTVALQLQVENGQSLIIYPDGTWDVTEYKGH